METLETWVQCLQVTQLVISLGNNSELYMAAGIVWYNNMINETFQHGHLRVLEALAVQDDFGYYFGVRDHHCHRAEASLAMFRRRD